MWTSLSLFVICQIFFSCVGVEEGGQVNSDGVDIQIDGMEYRMKSRGDGIYNLQPKFQTSKIQYTYGFNNEKILYAYLDDTSSQISTMVTYNENGTVWSITNYENDQPYGGVYCISPWGDTVQYYFHSRIHNGLIVFSCHVDTSSAIYSCSGNPLYSIVMSSDTIAMDDTLRIEMSYAEPVWAIAEYEFIINGNTVQNLIIFDYQEGFVSAGIVAEKIGNADCELKLKLTEIESGVQHEYSRHMPFVVSANTPSRRSGNDARP